MTRTETPKPVRGTQDMIGETAARFAHVAATFDRVRKLYGFGRIEVPMFEATAVFARSLGETTDVVSKEMYTFEDRGGDSLTLRPEFTAGIARAYLTEGWQQYAPLKVATHRSRSAPSSRRASRVRISPRAGSNMRLSRWRRMGPCFAMSGRRKGASASSISSMLK